MNLLSRSGGVQDAVMRPDPSGLPPVSAHTDELSVGSGGELDLDLSGLPPVRSHDSLQSQRSTITRARNGRRSFLSSFRKSTTPPEDKIPSKFRVQRSFRGRVKVDSLVDQINRFEPFYNCTQDYVDTYLNLVKKDLGVSKLIKSDKEYYCKEVLDNYFTKVDPIYRDMLGSGFDFNVLFDKGLPFHIWKRLGSPDSIEVLMESDKVSEYYNDISGLFDGFDTGLVDFLKINNLGAVFIIGFMSTYDASEIIQRCNDKIEHSVEVIDFFKNSEFTFGDFEFFLIIFNTIFNG